MKAFTFQYGSIQMFSDQKNQSYFFYLHSNMVLFKLLKAR